MGTNVALRAQALVGARFRPQGRSAVLGVDCIGLVALATGAPAELVPRDYDLRSTNDGRLAEGLSAAGLACVRDAERREGDVLVVRAGFAQAHLVVLTEGGFVHADAGMRRVVEVPGAVPWEVIGAWRARTTGLVPPDPFELEERARWRL